MLVKYNTLTFVKKYFVTYSHLTTEIWHKNLQILFLSLFVLFYCDYVLNKSNLLVPIYLFIIEQQRITD